MGRVIAVKVSFHYFYNQDCFALNFKALSFTETIMIYLGLDCGCSYYIDFKSSNASPLLFR